MNIFNNARFRRPFIRGVLVLLWVGLGVIIFLTGRAHTLLIDNQRAADGSYNAIRLAIVTIDNQNREEIAERERIRTTVAGTKHTIRVEFIDGRPPVEQKFELPIKEDMYMLSVPKMLAGLDFVEVFRVADQVRQVDEKEETEPNSFSF